MADRPMSQDSHEIFLDKLHRSHLVVLLFTQHLRHSGCSVILPSIEEAERKEDAHLFSDSYDLVICYTRDLIKDPECKKQIVNVKEARAQIFTDTHHPWDGLFVTSEADYRRAEKSGTLPEYYAIISANGFDYAWIDAKTKAKWQLVDHNDGSYGWNKKAWRCPWHQLEFGTINNGL